MNPLIIIVGVLGVAALLVILIYIKNLRICQPSEALILSGFKHRLANGKEVGYRVVKGGRAFQWPLIEVVDTVDLTNMAIDLMVRSAYSKGGIPLVVQGVANVKIASHEPLIHHAVERFLGKDRAEIIRIAKETLEGNLRGVLATLTPEQVNEDKLKFADSLLHEAEHDLSKLGLTLDNLKIQNVTDEAGYLSSLGRRRNADLQKNAQIAEAQAQSEAAIRAAKNEEETLLAQIDAEMKVAYAEAQRLITDAQTKEAALIAAEKGAVAQMIAKAKAEFEVQKARVEQQKRQLAAEVLEPAKAEMISREKQAKAAAAKIIVDGAAEVNAFRQLIQTWKTAGGNAKDVMVLQKFNTIVGSMLSTLSNLKIDRLTVINSPGANGSGSSLGAKALALNEELKATVGVDLAAATKRILPAIDSSTFKK
jgi:flotillin